MVGKTQSNLPERNGGSAKVRTPNAAKESGVTRTPKAIAGEKAAKAKAAEELKAKKPVRRRASDGRLDPEYAADLLAKSGMDLGDRDTKAFLDRPKSEDPIAEGFGESFLQSATSGEDNDADLLDPDDPEEQGGPFVETSAEDEFAFEPDASNPEDAEPEPFPTTQSNS